MSHRQDMDAILKQVENWPQDERLSLAYQLLRGSAESDEIQPAPRDTLSRALGRGRGKGAPPSDELVRQWIHEHRMAKYGR